MKESKHNKLYQNLINTSTVLGGSAAAAISIGMDKAEANAIFDAARTANSKLLEMSDQEIIDYCTSLDPNELQGMVSLVHGRVFENIVVDETGGVLFETKNHPNTDMMLDGEEISIKSIDATANSISDVETLSPQDFDMDDSGLRETTASVLDGDIIDAVDIIISGSVGLGTIAILKAVGKTKEEWEELEENEKTRIMAAKYGAKATERAAAGTIKSAINLVKLVNKGLEKSQEIHDEWADNGGYDRLATKSNTIINQIKTQNSIFEEDLYSYAEGSVNFWINLDEFDNVYFDDKIIYLTDDDIPVEVISISDLEDEINDLEETITDLVIELEQMKDENARLLYQIDRLSDIEDDLPIR